MCEPNQASLQNPVRKRSRFSRVRKPPHISIQTKIIEINQTSHNQQRRQYPEQTKPGQRTPQWKFLSIGG